MPIFYRKIKKMSVKSNLIDKKLCLFENNIYFCNEFRKEFFNLIY